MVFGTPDQLIEMYGAGTIIQALEGFITPRRLLKLQEVISRRIGSVHVAVEAPSDIHNALAVVRTAEALGVTNVHLINPGTYRRSGNKTAGGTLRWASLRRYNNAAEFQGAMAATQCVVAGAAPGAAATLSSLPLDRPLCLLFGNEQRGLSEEALASCDITFSIPMFGLVESYNLSVSAAISLYDVLSRKRELLAADGDLTDYSAEKMLAVYIIKSMGCRGASIILSRHAPLMR